MELTALAWYFIIFSTVALCIFTFLDTLYLILSNMNYDEKYHPDVENEEDQDHPDVENDENQDRNPSAGASIFKSLARPFNALRTFFDAPLLPPNVMVMEVMPFEPLDLIGKIDFVLVFT